MRIYFKPSLFFRSKLWSRFSLQALTAPKNTGAVAGLSAAIGAKNPALKPCCSRTSKAIFSLLPSLLFTIIGGGFAIAAHAQTFNSGFDMVWLGDARISFNYNCVGSQPGVQFLHVHENETTAVQAAKDMLKKTNNGCFVTWQCQQDRYVQFKLNGQSFKFDPNRIYTDAGARATLDSNGPVSQDALTKLRAAAQSFTTKYVDSMKLVVALHNNTDGGGLSIKSYAKGGPYAAEAEAVNIGKSWDTDDFFYTTDKAIFKYLAAKKFNIVLQNNSAVTDDGSLSVYAGNKGIAYLNVEAQHGHLSQQLKMLEAVQELINSQYQ